MALVPFLGALMAACSGPPVASMRIPTVAVAGGGDARMQLAKVGLYNVPREQVRTVIRGALDAGIRNFDFASFYDNEKECGAALDEWFKEGHERSEVFVTTKVWTTDLGDPDTALRSAEISIDELGLGYVDCLMVHWPMPGKHVAAYQALQKLVEDGKAKCLGISNYSPQDWDELMKVAKIAPAVNTFENNPMLYRQEWVEFFHRNGMVVEAYKPMQRGGPVLACQTVADIAKRLGKTPAQVCLRWNVEKGNVVLFKSLDPARIAENVGIFDFQLSEEDVRALDALTTEESLKEAQQHWEKRRNGTPAPWGDEKRPESRRVAEEAA